MEVQLPFTVWDIVAAVGHEVPVIFGSFWAALTPGMKLVLIVMVIVAILLPSSPARSPVTYRRRRRRWNRRWDE